MLELNDAISLLEHHASVTPCSEEVSHTCLSYAIYLNTNNHAKIKLAPLVDQVIDCLEVFNLDVNGDPPSRFGGADKKREVDIRVVRAIGTLQSDGMNFVIQSFAERALAPEVVDVLAAFWAISCAWEAVLAGDIDSLREHVDSEARAKAIPRYE